MVKFPNWGNAQMEIEKRALGRAQYKSPVWRLLYPRYNGENEIWISLKFRLMKIIRWFLSNLLQILFVPQAILFIFSLDEYDNFANAL